VLRVYDTVGWIALMALVFLAPRLLDALISPVIGLFDSLLLRM